ncbi:MULTISPECIES: hypothetical protein [unclassified Microcystis]|uniref:hypothetical protein n=1 Tax=unclassified Microcystis TaxID=2643300 RepID=UPI0011964BE6|nr:MULTISPECIES: hypothetical protein [unclassified Microcystis]MCA2928844.1 hypothetical protein [Microcystis sp. M020S1]MCA2933258.1 hypothetical protein [Microcystis sp. M015S1]MCA2620860.1 hypothetical protein [Microcystis sp. M099S2]MCA2650543.1 hypothetical protein [Microcystis sp. M065S2]MCA2680856.1 hypothetical protein [Microcystis sp. M043S2]
MNSPPENIHEETESLPKIDSSKVESKNVSPFFTRLPEEPEILENRIDYEAVNLYRKYVNKLRTMRQGYLLGLIFSLAGYFILCLIGASFYLSLDGREIAKELKRFFRFPNPETPMTIELFIVIGILLLSIFVIIGFILDNFSFGSTLRRSNTRLKKLELAVENNREELERKKLLDPQVRLENLYQDYRKIAEASGRVFFESTKRYEVAQKWRRDIGSHLEHLRQNPAVETELLNEVQYLLGSLKEIIDREKREQKGQMRWQISNIIVIIFYITSLTAIMLIAWIKPPSNNAVAVPYISVPVWALIWGALGSLSAILYKFYIVKRRVKFSIEFQWLIARPIIGILMSAVAYLAVTSGLILLGAKSSSSLANELDASNNATRFTAIVCFLAGFSDRVYLGIINLLVSKTLSLEKDSKSPTENFSVTDESVDFYDTVLSENSGPQQSSINEHDQEG